MHLYSHASRWDSVVCTKFECFKWFIWSLATRSSWPLQAGMIWGMVNEINRTVIWVFISCLLSSQVWGGSHTFARSLTGTWGIVKRHKGTGTWGYFSVIGWVGKLAFVLYVIWHALEKQHIWIGKETFISFTQCIENREKRNQSANFCLWKCVLAGGEKQMLVEVMFLRVLRCSTFLCAGPEAQPLHCLGQWTWAELGKQQLLGRENVSILCCSVLSGKEYCP